MKKPPEAPTIGELLSEESIFNKLANAIGDEAYTSLARRIDSKHRHWHKVQFMARAEGLEPELVWVLVRMAREGRLRTLPVYGSSSDNKLRYCVPDSVQEELMLIDQQLAGRITSADERPLTNANRDQFIISAIQEEAIASSMLEGAATTRKIAKKMLREDRKPRTHGERMVYNNYRAIQFVRSQRNTDMSVDFLLELQKIVTEDTLSESEESGRLRRPDEVIQVVDPYGELLHDPPHAAELPSRLNDFCMLANNKADMSFIHPVLQACTLHFLVGYLHPFCDGNGRTARAIFYWSMLRSGYWLFEFMPISRLIYESPAKYAMAFLYTETDHFDLTYFYMYKARILRRAREELRKYVSNKVRELAEVRQIYTTDYRLNHRQRDVIVRLVREPEKTISIRSHQGIHNIAYGTARSDLLKLAEWQYIEQKRLGNKFVYSSGPELKKNSTAQ